MPASREYPQSWAQWLASFVCTPKQKPSVHLDSIDKSEKRAEWLRLLQTDNIDWTRLPPEQEENRKLFIKLLQEDEVFSDALFSKMEIQLPTYIAMSFSEKTPQTLLSHYKLFTWYLGNDEAFEEQEDKRQGDQVFEIVHGGNYCSQALTYLLKNDLPLAKILFASIFHTFLFAKNSVALISQAHMYDCIKAISTDPNEFNSYAGLINKVVTLNQLARLATYRDKLAAQEKRTCNSGFFFRVKHDKKLFLNKLLEKLPAAINRDDIHAAVLHELTSYPTAFWHASKCTRSNVKLLIQSTFPFLNLEDIMSTAKQLRTLQLPTAYITS